jgi:hypothetical protein
MSKVPFIECDVIGDAGDTSRHPFARRFNYVEGNDPVALAARTLGISMREAKKSTRELISAGLLGIIDGRYVVYLDPPISQKDLEAATVFLALRRLAGGSDVVAAPDAQICGETKKIQAEIRAGKTETAFALEAAYHEIVERKEAQGQSASSRRTPRTRGGSQCKPQTRPR